MIATRLFAAALLLATGVLASPTPSKTTPTEDEALGGTPASKRALPTSTVTCGSNKYTVAKIVSAVSVGGNYLAAGSAPGGYPHRFYNYEGLNMWCSSVPSGPWYEFPILSSGASYSGGSPGADRVVFTSNATYCATITHTGASSTNGFVQCQND